MFLSVILSCLALVSGVDLQLATHRAEAISNVHYEITLDFSLNRDSDFILTDRRAPVDGHILITFNAAYSDDVVLDFSAEGGLLNTNVNGELYEPLVENGHIVIGKERIRKGQNEIEISFRPGNNALNHREDFVYTLLVPDKASMLFPCFDQPDIKAKFRLHLLLPSANALAVSNSPVVKDWMNGDNDSRNIDFAETEPLPTYLFAFAAGNFRRSKFTSGGNTISIYYRETDSARIAQLKDIYNEVDNSIEWLENYTGIPYPFAKYDLVILPGFQFGGMEHTGATFYNDEKLFLPPQPTQKERLERVKLIAHETAHMWFGDAVTMRWFNDVWLKEVFANYYAAKIAEPMFPDVDHELNFLREYHRAAIEQDRTEGRTAIRQELDNMNDAPLIYNNIIYDKAPIMMKRLADEMGENAFREGIGRYLRKFMYGNATWQELVEILDSVSNIDVKAFSDIWVNNPYWPERKANSWHDAHDTEYYGYTQMSRKQIDALADSMLTLKDAQLMAALITLHENYLHGNVSDARYLDILTKALQSSNELVCITAIENMYEPLRKTPEMAERIMQTGLAHNLGPVRTSTWRLLTDVPTTDRITAVLYDKWLEHDMIDISDRDYMTMAYELAVRMPEIAENICLLQGNYLMTTLDLLREFDFISMATYGSDTLQDTLFYAFLQQPENRKIETWVCRMLYYLNHPLRQEHAIKYIYPALEMVPEIHRTGAIFFPERWCKSLLRGHRSKAAKKVVDKFLKEHGDMNPLLINKIREASHLVY